MLGVYASAVHAQLIGANGKTVIKALAVSSEPYVFWCGEQAEEISQQIIIPNELGELISAEQKFNGPSGRTLDDLVLKSLGLLNRLNG